MSPFLVIGSSGKNKADGTELKSILMYLFNAVLMGFLKLFSVSPN